MTNSTQNPANASIHASEYTFGVELETTIPSGAVHVGGYHRGAELDHASWPTTVCPFNGRTQAWSTQYDSSLTAGAGRQGCEFVSPVLKGAAGLESVRNQIAKAKEIGATVNSSCGVHVHVGIPAHLSDAQVAAVVERLANIVGRVEGGILASTGSRRRFASPHYATPIKNQVRRNRWGKVRLARNDMSRNRYFGLNLTNIVDGRRRAVEFRYFSGSLNAAKVTAWIKMCVALTQYAVETTKRANPAVAPAGAGAYGPNATQAERELNRLFFVLGWSNGRCRFADLGDIETDFDRTEDKRVLRKMARNFAAGDQLISGFECLNRDCA